MMYMLLSDYHKYITSLIKLSAAALLSFDETTYIYILLMKYKNVCVWCLDR